MGIRVHACLPAMEKAGGANPIASRRVGGDMAMPMEERLEIATIPEQITFAPNHVNITRHALKMASVSNFFFPFSATFCLPPPTYQGQDLIQPFLNLQGKFDGKMPSTYNSSVLSKKNKNKIIDKQIE